MVEVEGMVGCCKRVRCGRVGCEKVRCQRAEYIIEGGITESEMYERVVV
jgi:hypothetical protein